MSRKSEDSLFNAMNRQVGRTIHQYDLIEDGDRILVAMSGGKDSLFLLYILKEFQKKAKIIGKSTKERKGNRWARPMAERCGWELWLGPVPGSCGCGLWLVR